MARHGAVRNSLARRQACPERNEDFEEFYRKQGVAEERGRDRTIRRLHRI